MSFKMIIALCFQQPNYCFFLYFFHQISNSRYMITTVMLLTECALLKMPL